MSDLSTGMQYILDTDTVTHQQRGHKRILANLALVDRSTVATTVITMYEQLRGRLAAVNRKQNEAQIQLSLLRLQETQRYFCTAQMLTFDEKAADIYRDLVGKKIRIGTQDLRIASIALANDAILVTANKKHFSQVPMLRVYDWINDLPSS